MSPTTHLSDPTSLIKVTQLYTAVATVLLTPKDLQIPMNTSLALLAKTIMTHTINQFPIIKVSTPNTMYTLVVDMVLWLTPLLYRTVLQ
jgi:hypothetical protein